MNQIEARTNKVFTTRNIVVAIFVTVAVLLLLTEHRSHFLSILPYVLLLACPFMHFFIHGARRKHESNDETHR